MPAMAEPGDKEAKKGDGGPRAEMREKMLKEFDKDGDGKLSDEEREKAHEKMRELHGDRGERGEGASVAKAVAAAKGVVVPEGGPDGPPKLPKPEELFAKFDKDKDEKLSKEEFMALADFVHEHMPPPPPGPPGGPRSAAADPMVRQEVTSKVTSRVELKAALSMAARMAHASAMAMAPAAAPRGPGGPPRDGEEGRGRRRPDGPPPEGGPGGRPPKDEDDDKDDEEKGDKDKAEADKDKAESAA